MVLTARHRNNSSIARLGISLDVEPLLGLDAEPDEYPENSHAGVRTIFMRDDFKSVRHAHKAFVETRGDCGLHFKLCTPYILGHQVDGSEDNLYTAISIEWQLLAIGRQINPGWPLVLHCDALFNDCCADLSLI
jgi:hypothetical protein